MEIDEWLFEFAQLFRTHVGIDPDAHVDLHELGMELCAEALEETVTSEGAQSLFDKAAAKFLEVAALAFFNWSNVHCGGEDESCNWDVGEDGGTKGEMKDPNSVKEEFLRRKKKQESGGEGEAVAIAGQGEISPEEAAEQAAVMRSQIHLFWGNMLFERSQVECKLGFDGRKEKLDAAVERFKLAGASEADILVVLKNHCSNSISAETTEKQAADNANNNFVVEMS